MQSNNILLLKKILLDCDIEATDNIIAKLDKYKDMVLEWNEKINLTAIKEEDEFVLKHFVDSLMCCHFKGINLVKLVADVGTGAGLPGIPLAIVFPEKKFDLMDSLNKRLKFLNEVVQELNLENVTLIHGRAEDIGRDDKYREKYDMVLSRAVARLNILSEYCLPLVKKDGTFAAYKSSDAHEEVLECSKAIEVLGGKLDTIQDDMTEGKILNHKIIYIKKVNNTPKQYPRKAGEPTKNPII